MSCAESIMLALIPAGKAADAFKRTQGFKLVLATGQNLVHIGLMANVKYDFVLRAVKHFMQRQSQLNDPQVGGKVTARPGNRLNHQFADFLG